MKEYRFRYGDGEVVIPLDEGQVLGELHGNHVPAAASIPDTLRAALENPIGLPPLRQWTKPGERVALVISDMSRFWMRQDKVIPPLVDYLRDECGIPEDHVTIIVANGTHDGGDEKELRTLVTDGVYDRVRVVNHDCLAKDLVYLGTTAHDTPVWINAEAAHADRVICLGACTHHVMAGFGGGPAEYFGWIDDLLGGTMEKRLREHFTVPGYIFLLNCEQAHRYNILMLTSVPQETVAPMGLKAFSDVDELMKAAHLEGKSLYVIPNGSTVVPYVKEKK